ncbi:hypothetical protein EST62_12300 [Chlorobaculum sp. 24CR]|uniref:hypothetical protein n=1 Tax=Chlorobaculum sp. 24CR TaxID=2508878 RepID=UPI00100B2936|nr:hypothetical protein [Chlorobaculum sp. 24CR]RXK81068.1 hypothetical protein EST62_12300 [Chlorobaculum sp. 24CR]
MQNKIMFFSLGGFFEKRHILLPMLEYLRIRHEASYENVFIKKVYDSFPNMIWAGGRTNVSPEKMPLSEVEELLVAYNRLGVGVYLTLTNHFIDKIDLSDAYCNEVLKILSQSHQNGVIVNSALLEKYVRNNYPSLKVSLSLIHFYSQPDLKSSFDSIDFSRYESVAIPPELNNVYCDGFMEKIEYLINETCPPNCKHKSHHYKLISLANKIGDASISAGFCSRHCTDLQNHFFLVSTKERLAFMNEEYGVMRFKFGGRGSSDKAYLLLLMYYFVKKEFVQSFLDYAGIADLNVNDDLYGQVFKMPYKEKMWA